MSSAAAACMRSMHAANRPASSSLRKRGSGGVAARRPDRGRWAAACAATVSLLLAATSAFAAEAARKAPASFGSDHDDPRTAYPAPAEDAAEPCVVEVLRHGFKDFEPARAILDAATRCPGPWSRIVLRIDGAVKGRQYDRIGHASVGGVTIFRTSTPEPSREGIAWQVQKDVSAYAPLFAAPQPVELAIGNVVDGVHDGVFDVALSFAFHPVDARHPAIDAADAVLALQDLREDGADTVGRASVPRDTERLVAEVYATGSGGGCEEFWYFATRADGYWCHAPQGPYREVQVLVDGRIAGIAAPYPHVYTGGWSNPFLWYAIPAPRAFDIPPVRYELTPFLGLLGDGRPHEIRFRVAGLPARQEGWTLMPNLQLWRDPSGEPVRARLLDSDAGQATFDDDQDVRDPGHQRMLHRWQRRFHARGVVEGSRGAVETTVERDLHGDVHHRWTAREDGDDHLLAEWRDREVLVRKPARGAARTTTLDRRFGLDGALVTRAADGHPRLTTTLDIHDDALQATETGGAPRWTRIRDRYTGTASYTGEVPREQRAATADTRQAWRREDSDGGCEQRTLANVNGRFTEDRRGCATPQPARDAHLP